MADDRFGLGAPSCHPHPSSVILCTFVPVSEDKERRGISSSPDRMLVKTIRIMSKYLLFTSSTELVRIPIETLVYVTADGNYSSITTADGGHYVLTLQIGQIERKIADMVEKKDHRFIRIGKSLVINRTFISLINHGRQRLVLSDNRSFRYEVSASREALKSLKDIIEMEVEP